MPMPISATCGRPGSLAKRCLMPTHAEKLILPYTPEEMFDLVADVEKYPQFLPWCVATRVTRKDDNQVMADMVIGYKMFRERFTSRVTLDRSRRIDVAYFEGPFKYLNNHWIFQPREGGACEIDFFVDFEFRSALLRRVIGLVFNEAVRIMVRAFAKRAETVYGKR